MAQTQVLNRRKRSVQNAKQITKAMEVVAASRMRRVSEAASKARSYGELADSIIAEVSSATEAKLHPYFKQNSIKSRLYVIFTSDRGMAGAYNSNIFSMSARAFAEDQKSGIAANVVVIGRKGSRYFSRYKDAQLLAAYDGLEDVPQLNVFAPIIETINDGFNAGQFGSVNIIFTEFASTLNQTARNLPLLPIDPSSYEQSSKSSSYELEPNNDVVLSQALRLYLEAQLMRAKVESSASEYAMRMLAMSNANRNASDLIDHLTLELNATRQAAITQEIAEITGGANAIE